MNELTSESVSSFLQSLTPGKLPLPIFSQISRLSVLPVIEIVPLVNTAEGIKVLLFRRDPLAPYWPNLWSIPGTIILPTDNNLTQALLRLRHTKLKEVKISLPEYSSTQLIETGRGKELAVVYYSQIKHCPFPDNLFLIKHIPSDIVKSQIGLIKSAYKSFVYRA